MMLRMQVLVEDLNKTVLGFQQRIVGALPQIKKQLEQGLQADLGSLAGFEGHFFKVCLQISV